MVAAQAFGFQAAEGAHLGVIFAHNSQGVIGCNSKKFFKS
jgi:hypothetical protein